MQAQAGTNTSTHARILMKRGEIGLHWIALHGVSMRACCHRDRSVFVISVLQHARYRESVTLYTGIVYTSEPVSERSEQKEETSLKCHLVHNAFISNHSHLSIHPATHVHTHTYAYLHQSPLSPSLPSKPTAPLHVHQWSAPETLRSGTYSLV